MDFLFVVFPLGLLDFESGEEPFEIFAWLHVDLDGGIWEYLFGRNNFFGYVVILHLKSMNK